MKLCAIGDRVWFEMIDGRTVHAGDPSYGLLYDGEGAYWPRCSVLVGPYTAGTKRVSLDRAAQTWFGPRYALCAGHVDLPPRRLSLWKDWGPARRMFYYRRGEDGARPPGPKQHPFNEPGWFDLFAPKAPVHVFARGVWLRLELPSWCKVDGGGFKRP